MGVKTGIFDLTGSTLSVAYREYPIENPYPGWAQQDPQIWWVKTIETVKEAIYIAKISPEQIIGIGVCGQGHGPTPLTNDGRVIDNCIIWPDRRTDEQVNWIRARLGSEYGNPTLTAVKILWWKQVRPEIFETADIFLLPTNFIVFKLSDQFTTDYTNASMTDLYDIETGDWSDSILDIYEIPREKLPEIHDPWEVIGKITKKAADETGLKTGTPVVPGGGDWACTIYGAGYVKPGRAVNMIGTVDNLYVASTASKPLNQHIIVSTLDDLRKGITQTSGVIYRWFRDQFGIKTDNKANSLLNAYQLLDQEAAQASPGLLLTPHFLGEEHWGQGVRYGMLFGLTLDTKRSQIIRAIMEALAYELRRDGWGDIAPSTDIEEVRAIGGGARSSVWMQIKADILGVPYCRINIDEGGCFGAAMLAGVGVGLFSDVITPIEEFVHVIKRSEPRDEAHRKYSELYIHYCKLIDTLGQSKIYEEYNETLRQLGLRFER